MGENAVAQQIVDAAFRVHTTLGPGLLESVYEAALAYELEKRGLSITRQQGIPVVYEGVRIHAGFFADLVVEDQVIVEIKAVETVAPVHSVLSVSLRRVAACPVPQGERLSQNPANRGAADLQAAGDLGFADAGTMQLPYFVGVETCGGGPTQPLAVLPGMGQAGAHAFPQNLSFELREYGQ